ncbi:MAG: hypothetical protein ACRC0L_08510 [Angustibacter sp.]
MLQLRLDQDERDREDAQGFEAAVFTAAFGASRDLHDREYGPWLPWTRFAMIRHDERRSRHQPGQVVGVVRLIGPNPLGPHTLHAASQPPWSVDPVKSAARARLDLTSTWDVATIAIAPPGQRPPGPDPGPVAWHAILRIAAANQVSAMVAVLDAQARSVMDRMGLIVHDLYGCQPEPYQGSRASTPVHRHIPDLLTDQQRLNPAAHQLIALGQDLPDVTLPRHDELIIPISIDIRSVNLTQQTQNRTPKWP